MAHRWDPQQYLAYADERSRPFVELMARVPDGSPGTVVDLGCGPGQLTELLARRWPGASVTGVDSSVEMIERARADGTGAVAFEVGDVRTWAPTAPVDVLVSNATLHWVPGHLELLARLVGHLAPAGWLAVQVPGNFAEPSHTLCRALAEKPPYAAHTRGVAEAGAHDPAVYLETLAGLGCAVDAWETTYLHALAGDDAVFEWISGTAARPTLQALPGDLRPAFENELKARLRAAYPPGPAGTILPFRRVFVVARAPGSP